MESLQAMLRRKAEVVACATGQMIHGYRLLQDFTTVGGGLSRWTFVEKNGRSYFLKEFLAPKYPTDDSPGSARVKKEKRQRCERFEQHHARLRKALSSACAPGGNLVYTIDFFREGAKYYKVTDKVDCASLRPEQIARLPLEGRVLVMKTVAHSVRILHYRKIVHGDLKPDNILITQSAEKKVVAKLIDFDNSYFAGEPPDLEDEAVELVGDQVYYSPELSRYFQRDERVLRGDLHTASDIFSLGLIYCQYLTGSLPLYTTDKFRYACDAVYGGDLIALPKTSERLPVTLAELVLEMLSAAPNRRPSIEQIFRRLKDWKRSVGKPGDLDNTKEHPTESGRARLRGNLVPSTDTAAETEPTSIGDFRGSLTRRNERAEPQEEAASSRLRGTLKNKMMWRCVVCETYNTATARHCEVCQTAKPFPSPPASEIPDRDTQTHKKNFPIRFRCDNCDQVLRAKEQWVGKKGTCPRCGNRLTVPATEKPVSSVGEEFTIRFRCPNCNRIVKAKRQWAGKNGECSACGAVSTIPASD